MPQLLDNLEIPQPPYRMARPVQRVHGAPVATLAMADESEKPPRDETSEEQLQRQFKGAVERLEAPSSPEAVDASVDDAAIDAIKKAPMKSDAILQEKQKYLDAASGKTPQSASGRLGEKGLGLRITPEIQEAGRIAEEKRAAEKSPVVPSVSENKAGEAQVEVPQSDLVPPEKPGKIVLPDGKHVEVIERDTAGVVIKSKRIKDRENTAESGDETPPFIQLTPEQQEAMRVAGEKGLENERNKDNFDIEFPQPPAEGSTTPETTPVIPELDSLTKIQGYIEDSRRQGRSPEFIKGLEMMRKDYIEKARRPVSNSGRVNIQPGTPEGEALAAARKAAEEALDNRDTQRAEGEGMTGVPAPENQAERKVQEERARKEDIAYKSAVTRAQSKAIKENEERGTDAPEGTTPEVSPDESLDILREAGEGKGPVPPPEGEKRPQENVLDVLREGQGETSPAEFGSERISTPATPEIERARADAESAEREPNAQERRVAQLEEKIRQLEARLSEPVRAEAGGDGGSNGGGGGEQPASAEGGGGDGGPGEGEKMLDSMGSSPEDNGETQEPGWLERVGIRLEVLKHDAQAHWSEIWAKRAKDALKKRDVKVKELEKKAKAMTEESWVGTALSPTVYYSRIVWHKWRKGLLEAAQAKHDARRAVHENFRNDLLNGSARQYETALRTYQERARENKELSDQLDEVLDVLDRKVSERAQEIAEERNEDRKAELIVTRDELMRLADETAREKFDVDSKWAENRKDAERVQSRVNQILKYAKLPTADTKQESRERLETRQKRDAK